MEKCPKCGVLTSTKPVQIVSATTPKITHAPIPAAQWEYKCGQTNCGHIWVKQIST